MSGVTTKPSAFADDRRGTSAARLGLRLFIVSLAILFGATVVGFMVMRYFVAGNSDLGAAPWPTDLPDLPALLWLSTLVLLGSSGTIQWAVTSIRRSAVETASRALIITLVLAFLFLALQAVGWWMWHDRAASIADSGPTHRFALTAFYVTTALHAAHVVGGLGPMLVTTRRALRGRYTADSHGGIERCAAYWHFLGVVWIVLYAMLLIGMRS